MGEPARLVIFDCDGVLVDSERLAIRIDAMVLADVGWPMREEEIVERFVGKPDTHMLAEVQRHTGKDVSQAWNTTYAEMYRTAFEEDLTPVPGIVEALDAIETATCVASSGTHERIQFTLGITGLIDRFDGRIYSAQDVARGKPFPDLFLHAASQMGTPVEECVVVEDSVAGVEAARAAGIRVLAYGAGVTPPTKLAGPNTTVFTNMTDLPSLL
ncbi:MAG: HAD-IA family hydrolase [Proteobacteria bacterium]|nr:HAD-IA family hydrolase [Pseudomonadota bacterium]